MRRSIAGVAFDRASVGLAFSAAGLVLTRLVRSLHGDDALWLAVAAPVGLWVADLVSALAHWFGDTFFDRGTPLFGAIVGPFRLHHDDPGAFRRHDFFERNRNNCLAALPLLLLVYFVPLDAGAPVCAMLSAVLAVAAVGLASATQIHAWAHDRDAPRPVRWLQHCGILISNERHARHHRGAHDRSYGIVNGWTNGVLDRTRFFRWLESLAALAGLRPSIMNEDKCRSRA
jgi:ubiquitin-conjugating enzyme E2 variant